MIKLSKPSKMPCNSWSLEALTTCPASLQDDGELVPACQGCYATTGFYNMPVVKDLRVHNKEDWKRDGWVEEMVGLLTKSTFFRWFDSGDVYDKRLAVKILEVMARTPLTKHWLPTRMHKFIKFKGVFHEMEILHNVVVRYSSDSITGELIDGLNSSTILPYIDTPTTATVCEAYERGGKCGDCRKCWDKDTKIIAYPMHGKKGMKMIALLEVLT